MKKLLFIFCFSSSVFCMQPGRPPAQLVPSVGRPKSMVLNCCTKTAEGVSYGCDMAGELGGWCSEPTTSKPFREDPVGNICSPHCVPVTSLATVAACILGGPECASCCCMATSIGAAALCCIRECRGTSIIKRRYRR